MKKIQEKIYRARNGAPFKKEDAQVIGEYVANFKTPEDILEDSKKKESPVHGLIDWDDSTAAYQHRISQIRDIVNHIEVEIVYIGGEVVKFDRAMIYVVKDSEKVIMDIEEALNKKETKDQVIKMAFSTLVGWVNRYEKYKEFRSVVDAAKVTETKLRQLHII